MASEADKVKTGALATILTVGALALIGTLMTVIALVRCEVDSEAAVKGGAANLRPIQELEQAQLAELNNEARRSDLQAGRYNIPIERAMRVVVRDLQRDPNTATAPALAPDAGAQPDAAALAQPSDTPQTSDKPQAAPAPPE